MFPWWVWVALVIVGIVIMTARDKLTTAQCPTCGSRFRGDPPNCPTCGEVRWD